MGGRVVIVRVQRGGKRLLVELRKWAMSDHRRGIRRERKVVLVWTSGSKNRIIRHIVGIETQRNLTLRVSVRCHTLTRHVIERVVRKTNNAIVVGMSSWWDLWRKFCPSFTALLLNVSTRVFGAMRKCNIPFSRQYWSCVACVVHNRTRHFSNDLPCFEALKPQVCPLQGFSDASMPSESAQPHVVQSSDYPHLRRAQE